MYIRRDSLLQKIISYKEKDIVKAITGIRRCGKSVLLMEIYKDWLIDNGISDDHIIRKIRSMFSISLHQ